MEDPSQPGKDISGGSSNIRAVSAAEQPCAEQKLPPSLLSIISAHLQISRRILLFSLFQEQPLHYVFLLCSYVSWRHSCRSRLHFPPVQLPSVLLFSSRRMIRKAKTCLLGRRFSKKVSIAWSRLKPSPYWEAFWGCESLFTAAAEPLLSLQPPSLRLVQYVI